MQETEPHRLVRHIRSKKHPSKKIDSIFCDTKKGKAENVNSNILNKIIRIKHRRKLQQQEQKKTIVPNCKNKYSNAHSILERFSYFHPASEKESSEKSTRANIQMNTQRDFETLSRVTLMPKSSGSKIIHFSRKEERQEKQSPKLKKFMQNWEKKIIGKRQKNTANQFQNRRFKKIETLVNKTTSNADNFFEEESFVDLISKYRFDNLKTYAEPCQLKNIISGDDVSSSIYKSKQPLLFSRKCENLEKLQNSQKKMNKTAGKGWKEDKTCPTIKKRISILSPWQNDSFQFGSNHELL